MYIDLVYSIILLFLIKIVAEQWILAIIFDLLNHVYKSYLRVQFSSVTQLCLTLCNPMDCSTPSLPVHHQLPEFTETHVHQVSDAIQPPHPLSSPSSSCPQSLPALESFPMSQLFTWGSQSTGVSALASFLPKNTQDWSLSEWTENKTKQNYCFYLFCLEFTSLFSLNSLFV